MTGRLGENESSFKILQKEVVNSLARVNNCYNLCLRCGVKIGKLANIEK